MRAFFFVLVALLSGAADAATCFVGGGKYFTDFSNAAQEAAQASCTQRMVGTATIVQLYPPPYPYGTGATYKCSGEPTTERFVDVPSSSQPSCANDPKDCTKQPNLGTFSTRWTYSGPYPGFGGGYCIDGCSYDLFGDEGYDKESNTSVAHGYMKSYGTSCSGPAPKTPDPTVNGTNPSTAPSATDPNPSVCQAGQVPYTGTVNGKTVTVCGTADKSSSTGSTSTSSSGSTTTNNNGTQTTSNTSGTSGSTSKTTCENGSCTTTTSSTSSSGGGASSPGGTSTSGTETKTEPKEKFCADNPTSPLCKDSNSSFGGGCGAFQCEGDAVQCATARATQELLCATKVSDSDPALLAGQQAVNGGDRPAWHPRSQADSSTFSLASMLDTAPLFGTTGNCIADKTVPMLGKTLTIPFSRMCTALELLGAAFLASCYLGAAYIVFRR